MSDAVRTLVREARSESKAVADEDPTISRGDNMICYLLAEMLEELRK